MPQPNFQSHTPDTITYALHGNLYLNITNRCTLRCRFCPKFNKVWDVQSYNLRLSHEPEPEVVLEAIGDPKAYRQLVFCGLGEPTLKLETLLQVASSVKAAGGTVRLNTDGLANAVYKRDVTAEMAECVDEVSVSLNAQNREVYDYHCRPQLARSYEHMLDFVEQASGRFAKVYVSALDGLEGVDIDACRKLATKLGVDYRPRSLGRVG